MVCWQPRCIGASGVAFLAGMLVVLPGVKIIPREVVNRFWEGLRFFTFVTIQLYVMRCMGVAHTNSRNHG